MTSVPQEIVQAMGAEPTDEQWTAISMPLEPCVVVAGAGSGKTSVIAARVVYLALVALGRVEADHPGVLPGNVLCLTFTNKATENLLRRVRRALGSLDLPEGEEPEVLNYHSFAAQVLERYGLLAGIEPAQRVLTPAQRTELCSRVLDEMSFREVSAEWQPTVVSGILELAQQAADHCVELDRIVEFNREQLDALKDYESDEPYRAALQRIELAEAARAFERLKRERQVIDFADQITLALQVVEGFPHVAKEYRSRFSAVVLDEYQDTNIAQGRMIAALFADGFPVTAVGDPDQNIYAWRGASLFNLLRFQTQFPCADGSPSAKLPLYTNFRSGARILAAADTVIRPLPPEQRPDPGKLLVPWDENGEGEVHVARYGDERAEAEAVAERILALHDDGEAWSSCAVLCRTSRLFFSLQEAFAERDIPVEVVGLAGLLTVPEVVEVLAYARAVADPLSSVSLARILLGPRYRVGFKELARVAAWAKERNYAWRETEEGEITPFLFAEALEHLDECDGISDEGRARLEEFRTELHELRELARRPVTGFLSEVIRRIGLLREVDAGVDPEVAAARRRNLAAFLDEVQAFSPVDGPLTLRAFLDYVVAVEESEKPEWSPVQPSEENSVKMMTIHQAKGLEFDDVFVPGLAKDLLPSNKLQHNPATKGKSMDFALRGDAEILPRLEDYDGAVKKFWRALKDQELIEERRTCYVALTRARRRLFVSGAYWYGETQRPKRESEFLDELMAWGEETGLATVDAGPEREDENPLLGYRERLVRDWPGPALRQSGDEAFPLGWRRAALEAVASGAVPAPLTAALDPTERAAYETASAEARTLALDLAERAVTPGSPPWMPSSIAVGSVVDYGRCPKRFYWSVVRPLPRFTGPAARIGTEIHRWIERQASGQASLIELDEAPDLTPEELVGEVGRTERLREAFLQSRFAQTVPLFAERPFLLHLDGSVLSGRIDAIYGRADGAWEIVDYKTGRRPSDDDPLTWLQLDVYALACVDVWRKRPEDLRLTYLYLNTREEATRDVRDVEETRAGVIETLRGIAAERFDPTPGEHCRSCDFLSFCDAGKGYVEGR